MFDKNTTQLIARFAPSPTGLLHIGNARTAIFNFLIAKHYKGKFFLRIEDTDRERFSQEAVDVIFDSLRFLQLNWDNEEIIYQSQRQERYKEIVQILLDKNLAYKCYCTKEELITIKENNQTFRSPYRDTVQTLPKDFVIRLKIPNEGELTFQDDVQGSMTVKNKDIEEFVLLRSDGTPTYLLAVVVDDHDMNINYVLRGADHLTNTFKQIHIFNALDWASPVYAHIPLINDSTGVKLSKRTGAIGVLDYAKIGVLPEALLNYLMRLGWGYKDEEFIPLNHAIEIFTEKGFGRSAAKFDVVKLLDLSAKYMRFLSEDDIFQKAQEYQRIYMQDMQNLNWSLFKQGLSLLTQRSKTLYDLMQLGEIFLYENIKMEVEIETIDHNILIAFFENHFNTQTLEASFREYCTEHDLDFKQMASWLRKKLSGKKISPSLFDMMKVLGSKLCLKRITQ